MRRYFISKKVGKNIRKVRRGKGLTQEEVAHKARVHVSTLGRIERGESNSPIQTVDKIARALGVKPKKLF